MDERREKPHTVSTGGCRSVRSHGAITRWLSSFVALMLLTLLPAIGHAGLPEYKPEAKPQPATAPVRPSEPKLAGPITWPGTGTPPTGGPLPVCNPGSCLAP